MGRLSHPGMVFAYENNSQLRLSNRTNIWQELQLRYGEDSNPSALFDYHGINNFFKADGFYNARQINIT